MQFTKTRLALSTLSGLILCGVVSARITSAQGPGGGQGRGGQGRGGQGRGGQGQGGQGFGGGQGQGGRQGGFGGQTPFATGTITAGDANTGQITIKSSFGGSSQTLQISNSTQMVTQTTVTVADLQINDQVQVQGVPTGITASAITAGQMPTFLQGGQGRRGGNNGGGANNGNGGANNAGVNRNGGGQAGGTASAFASATGNVTSLSPLTISLGNNVSLAIKMAANARVTKISPVSFNNLKVGDSVMAAGQASTNGVFTATGIAVNMTMGGGMGPGGGQGGPPPGGGPGGPGGQGGPPPGGGQGGPPPDGGPDGPPPGE